MGAEAYWHVVEHAASVEEAATRLRQGGPHPAQIARASAIERATLRDVLGTDRPTRSQVIEHLDELLDNIERGGSRYILLYASDAPVDVMFLGWSWD